ncbi:hypothetical protein ACHAXA_008543 [Cyclostephanos tholiformis]|uniref:Uncharacterized protein n=1 Tax=Cyclostephanos tholiformis TaxID=382380 RepID=A0ABD3RHG7_9STRA
MTAPANTPPGTRRERGTPRGALPNHVPIVLIVVANFICSLLATTTLLFPRHSIEGIAGASRLAFVACLGSASASIGIVFGDSISHALAFGIAMLFVATDDGVMSALVAASPPLILVALSSVRGPTRRIINSLDRDGGIIPLLLGPIAIRSLCIVPIAMAMHMFIVVSNHHHTRDAGSSSGVGLLVHGATTPGIITLCIATTLVMSAYYNNRSHKNGNLLTGEMISQAIFAGISMCMSIYIALSGVESSPGSSSRGTARAVVVIAFLLGSLLITLFCHVLAAVSDVWYAVGSGQFHMVSLDTVGMILYFVCPALLLLSRFLSMHAEDVSSMLAMLSGGYCKYVGCILPASTSLHSANHYYGEDALPFSLAMMLAISSVIGVPLLNALCPMGGYLYSRAYTHGRPNTMKIALCVNFCDLPKDEAARKDVWESLSRRIKKTGDRTIAAVLNVFVTSEDMARYPDELRVIADRGHKVELAPVESSSDDGAFLFRPSLFRGKDAVRDLRIAQREYARLFGKGWAGPSWMLSRSASSIGRHPSVLREANDLGMKVAYWSTLVRLSKDRLTSELRSAINEDCSNKNGGSIIYVVLGKGVSSNSASGSFCELIDVFDGRCSLESLSDVAMDYAEMVLKR